MVVLHARRLWRRYINWKGITLIVIFLTSVLLVTIWINSRNSAEYINELVQRDTIVDKFSKRNLPLPSKSPNALSVDQLRQYIAFHNKNQTILNEDKFGSLKNDSLVVIIQVHKRIMYLKHSIMSFARAKNIEYVLLVFSHDYYDEDINSLIQSIKFCKVIQIFYPYSIQTHTNVFPGESPNDCSRNISLKEAVHQNCTNARNPDMYGHYREAKITQLKHHWWWKANYLFNELRATKYFTGYVMFFEEDHYVAPDFIHMLHLMEEAKQEHCPHCEILSLGSHAQAVDFRSNFGKAEISKWTARNSNLGIIFNRTVWEKFKSCAKMFCTYDDYNWDWSLLAISMKCVSSKITVMVLQAPRVYHIGECGTHVHSSCNMRSLHRIEKLLATSSEYLFPPKLQLIRRSPGVYVRQITANGGWGDVRDHVLCLKMLDSSCLRYCDVSNLDIDRK